MAKNLNTEKNHVEDVEHEVIEAPTQGQKFQPTTVNQKISLEIARFDLPAAVIAKMKEDYAGLTIAGVDDKEGYKAVKSAWQQTRNLRLSIENKRVEIKGDYLTITRAIDAKAKEYTDDITPLETHLKAELTRIDTIIEEERTRAEREKEAQAQARVRELIENGMSFNGSYYVIGDAISMDAVAIKNMPADEYARFLSKVQGENKKIIEARQAEERRKKEEREQMERQQREQEEERKKIEAERKKMEDERLEMKRAITRMRVEVLQNAGFDLVPAAAKLCYKTPDAGAIWVNVSEFNELTSDEWDKKFFKIREEQRGLQLRQREIEDQREAKRLEEEKRKKDEEEKARLKTERQRQIFAFFGHRIENVNEGFFIGYETETENDGFLIPAEHLFLNPTEWENLFIHFKNMAIKLAQKEGIYKTQQAQKKEDERLAKLSDVEKVKEWVAEFRENMAIDPKISDPELENTFKQFKKSVINLADRYDTFLNEMEKRNK
jgi:hypothetical protein